MRKILQDLLFFVGGAFLVTGALSAATLQVGPGQTYAKPCAAIAAAAPGDTILIDAAGSYSGDVCQWFTNSLTIRGVNGRPHIDAAGHNAAGKGIWVVDGNNTTIENVELSGASVADGNGAGIRFESYNLVVRNCYIHNNQDGILTNNVLTGDILIEYSEFANNGTGTGQTHNIYIGEQGTFTMRFSYSHNSIGGQLVKTRAAENHILYNRLTSETGTASYTIDIPWGGLSYVIGNLIEQGVHDPNSNVMNYMAEGANAHNPDHRLFVSNNTFVNDKTSGNFILITSADTTPIVVQNNIFHGPGTITTQAAAILSHNLYNAQNPLFVNQAGYDYHLQSGSPAINAGMDPGTGGGESLIAAYDYVHPRCGETRSLVGTFDIGAYEYGSTGTLLTCSSSGGAAALSALTLNPASVIGGTTSTATITLNNPAPPGGIVVTMTSSNGSVAAVPTNVTIAAGNSSASVLVTTGGVTSTTTVTISAAYAGVTKSATITVNPPTAPVTISNIKVVIASATSVAVTWTTNVAATAQLNYGLTSSYTSSVQNPKMLTSHAVNIGGLVAGATYHFQAISKDASGNQAASSDLTFIP